MVTPARRAVTWAVGAVAAQRIGELAWSRRNERVLLRRGAVEVGVANHRALVALHALWLAGLLVEGGRTCSRFGRWRRLALVAFVGVQPVRYWAIATLGVRWSTKVLVPPGSRRVDVGPYRWVDHPNYAVVVVELASFPLIFGAWRTSVAATIANAAILRRRVILEERALTAGGR